MLGGSHFVGHALVEVAVEAGHDVCALNRGLTGHRVPGARLLCADRTNESELTAAIGDEQFDSVIDTWSGAPTYVKSAAISLVRGRHTMGTYQAVRSTPGPIKLGWTNRAQLSKATRVLQQTMTMPLRNASVNSEFCRLDLMH